MEQVTENQNAVFNNNEDINIEAFQEDVDGDPLSIDVIIPVYKPDNKFRYLVERLVKQSVCPNHIFLLHTVETGDNLCETIMEEEISYALSCTTPSCPIEYIKIKKEDFDHGGTRNYGASLSNADIVMFMTQDAIPADKELIYNIRKPFHKEGVAVAYGRQLPHKHADAIEIFTRKFNYPDESYIKSIEDKERLGIKTYFCSNVCAAYRRQVYQSLGGFVTKTIFNEDMIMAASIINHGYQIAYVAQAPVYHSHVYTYLQQFKRNFDLAVSQQQYQEIFKDVKSESEGIKLVRDTLEFLIQKKKYTLIPDLILQSGFKYLGYKFGRNYEHLSKRLIIKLSMNPTYWKDYEKVDKKAGDSKQYD